MLADKIISVARKEIGVREIGNTNCGPRVNVYKAATELPPLKSWPWCAAYVCWVVREAANLAGVKFTKTFRRPVTASAWDFENWSLAQDNSTRTIRNPKPGDIQPGCIIIFNFSHIAFAVSKCDRYKRFETIEGNTDHNGSRDGGGVEDKLRKFSEVKTIILFTV